MSSPSGFVVEVTSGGGGRRISVTGEVDMSTAPQLADAIGDAVAGGESRIDVDLSGVGFIDSSGLRVLLGGRSDVEASGAELRVVAASPAVTRLLEATGLAELLVGG